MGQDKVEHAEAGAIIALFFLHVSGFGLATIALFVIGAAKELLWDKALKRGTPDPMDFIMTIAGGAAALLLCYLSLLLK